MAVKIKVQLSEEERAELAKKLADRRERLRRETEEKREAEIETSLSEIYRDSQGRKIDVNRMKIEKKQGFIFWFFNFLIFSLVAIVIGLGVYYYVIYGKGTDSTAVSVSLEAPEAVTAGEEFSYAIKYSNEEYVALKSASLKVEYPEHFIFLDAEPKPEGNNDSWNLGRLAARTGGEIKIKGKIIDKPKAIGVLLAHLTYVPENFSSEFKKETSLSLNIRDVGFDTAFDYSDTALVNQQGEVKITFKPLEKNLLSDFLVRLEKDDNVEIKNTIVNGGRPKDKVSPFKAEKIAQEKGDAWLISRLGKEEESFEIIYKIKSKTVDKQELKFYFEVEVGGKEYVFLEKTLPLEVMKSDLNLNLIMNGAQADQPVDFEEKLNYSIMYSNKGETAIKDVTIMAVLDSDFLDWTTLTDDNKGRERGNTITWTKEEIPSLEVLEKNESGTIDFSLSVLPFRESDLGKDFKVLSYAQYSVGDKTAEEASSTMEETASSSANDNRSNTITSIINSDLGFKEEARYFDESNLPVGNGPLPPKVGEKTSFKIYWTISNNLHELNELSVETVLPGYIEWDDRNRTSVGTLSYDSLSRKVIWQIGRLPITVFRADAEFNVSFTPTEEDRNKVAVILSGASVKAVDGKTSGAISKSSSPKTTRLEDDEIANLSSDGRVR